MSACGSSTLPWCSGQISMSPAPDCCPVGARSTATPRDSRKRRVAGPIVATRRLPGSQLLRVVPRSAALASQRLDRGHAADHEPRVGSGAEGVEGDVQGVLVTGELKVDERKQQRIGAHLAQSRDQVPGPVRAARDENPGALGHPHRGLPVHAVAVAVPSHDLMVSAAQEAARSAMSAAPRASRTSASSIPSRVAPTSVSPSVAFLSRIEAVPSTAQTTASRYSRLPLRNA